MGRWVRSARENVMIFPSRRQQQSRCRALPNRLETGTLRRWGVLHWRSIELAKMVGLGERLDHRPTQLSGGQQQRVAIARSLVNDPYFMLADEATGNLDSVTTTEILALFQGLNDEGRTIIMVTHEDEVAAHAKRIIRLKDGKIQVDGQVKDRLVFSPEEIREIARNANNPSEED